MRIERPSFASLIAVGTPRFRFLRHGKTKPVFPAPFPVRISPPRSKLKYRAEARYFSLCGGGEIRTHGPVAQTPVFKTGAFDHSATPPSISWEQPDNICRPIEQKPVWKTGQLTSLPLLPVFSNSCNTIPCFLYFLKPYNKIFTK